MGGKLLTEFHMSANHDGSLIQAELRAPSSGGRFRPTVLMERVSRYLESVPGEPSTREILDALSGKREGKSAALV